MAGFERQEVEGKEGLFSPNIYVGGEFKRAIDGLRIIRDQVPPEIGTSAGQCEILIRDEYLRAYEGYVNWLLEKEVSPITPPVVIIDRTQKSANILNVERSGRSEVKGGINPIAPGYESLTPPALLVIRPSATQPGGTKAIDGNDWIIRVFVNAFPYALPRKQTFAKTEEERIETVCGLSLVIALNPEIKQLHDTHTKNTAMFELLLFALGKATEIIAQQGHYWDKDNTTIKTFDAVSVYINEGPNAGGSLSKDEEGQPHAQTLALPRNNTLPIYRGDHFDAQGNCKRCEGIEEKTTKDNQNARRVVGKTKRAIAYVPKHEARRKGRMIRITPRINDHNNDLPSLNTDTQRLKDMALLLHYSIRAVALAQMKKKLDQPPSYNAIFAQDLTDKRAHTHIDVLDGVEGGGFAVVGPVYYTGDTPPDDIVDVFVQPPEIRETPEDVAEEFRSLVAFPNAE